MQSTRSLFLLILHVIREGRLAQCVLVRLRGRAMSHSSCHSLLAFNKMDLFTSHFVCVCSFTDHDIVRDSTFGTNTKPSCYARTHCLVLHRPLDDRREVLPPVRARHVAHARREVEHAPLRDRALDERRDVCGLVPDGLQPARHAEPVEEARDRLVQVRAERGVGDRSNRWVRGRRAVEDRERLAVAGGRGRRGELEDGGAGQGDAAPRPW